MCALTAELPKQLFKPVPFLRMSHKVVLVLDVLVLVVLVLGPRLIL